MNNAEFHFTQVEEHQAFRADRISTSKAAIIELSQRIGADTTSRDLLLRNPYTNQARTLLNTKFGVNIGYDAAIAVALSEPDRQFDLHYQRMRQKGKEVSFSNQTDSSAEMTRRMMEFTQSHKDEFWDMTPEEIYEKLSESTFSTSNFQEIDNSYSKYQRRGFRLAIVNFIDIVQKLKPYRFQFVNDVQGSARRYVGTTFAVPAEVEVLPIGFVVLLHKPDFERAEKIYSQEKPDKDAAVQKITNGFTLYSDNLPDELKGRIIVINKDNTNWLKTRRHELQHIINTDFLEMKVREWDMTPERIKRLKTREDHLAFAKEITEMMMSDLKNEVLAYASADSFGKDIDQVRGGFWRNLMDHLQSTISRGVDMEEAEKISILGNYYKEYAKYLDTFGEYQWIAKKLREAKGVDDSVSLLMNTPLEKARNLSSRFGISPDDVPYEFGLFKEELARQLSRNINRVTEILDTFTGKLMSSTKQKALWETKVGFESVNLMGTHLTVESLPALTMILDRCNHTGYLDIALDTVALVLARYGVTYDTVMDINKVLDTLIQKRRSHEFDAIRKKAGFLMLRLKELPTFRKDESWQ